MTTPGRPDFSHACWRCHHFDGLHLGVHGLCNRPGSPKVQASASTGCTMWTPGPGDTRPHGWAPDDYRPTPQRMMWGEPLQPLLTHYEPALLPGERFEHDQRAQASAWKVTDSLLSRVRR